MGAGSWRGALPAISPDAEGYHRPTGDRERGGKGCDAGCEMRHGAATRITPASMACARVRAISAAQLATASPRAQHMPAGGPGVHLPWSVVSMPRAAGDFDAHIAA